MKKGLLKLLALTVLVFSANMIMAQTYTYPAKGSKGISLTSKSMDKVEVNYSIQQISFESVAYRGEEMQEISLSSGIVIPNDAGLPNLPSEGRMIAIPQGAKPVLKVLDYQTETIRNVNVAPALRLQAESEEPEMDYKKDMKVYGKNAFYPEHPFLMSDAYIRGVDAVNLTIMPFQYNPVTKDLIVYTNVRLSIEFEGGTRHFGDDRLRSPYWDPILAAELMNYDQLPVIDYEARMQQWLRDGDEGAEYLIITPNNDAWAEYANQLKEYRTRQGIITKVYRLDEMPATSTDMMKSWFHNAYNTWDIAPVAVCLMGDHGTNMGQYIPAETVPHPYEGSCISDNRYADPSGDNLPDMVFSRLIAQSATELPVFVGKQIEYEYTNPNLDPNFYTRPITALGWQTERWFQICSEVVGGYMREKGYDPNRINCIYSGTPGGSWSSNQNTSMVVSYFGPSGRGYIPASPSELGGWTGGTPEQVVQAVNEGSFWLQHRDHGYEQGWGEPAVSNSHVAQMNNVDKLPFVMSINCLTGKFNNSSECFCEAWMRRTYNGQNAGAVGLLCPTEVSYSFVNDTYVWGVYDLFDGDFMPDFGPYQPAGGKTGNWMPAFGNVAGKYFLAQSNWPSNPDSKDITYTMFTAHCDAFLRIYTQVPQTMEVTHPEVVLAGLGEVNISAPEGCMISLVKEDLEGGWEILAVAEATGDIQTITFEPQVPPTEINLVVTGQNYLRFEALMSVIPANGPYIVFDSKEIHDADGNGQLDFAEAIDLDITLKNVGSQTMDSFDAVLETTSEYITITNGTAQYNSIAPNATQTLANAFSFVVADNVPDNTSNPFTITVTNGDDVYVSNLNIKAFAPVLELGNMTIAEIEGNGNGRLDPGETATLSFPIVNKGHSKTITTSVNMMLLSPYINVEETMVEFETINASETVTANFDISISEDTPLGYSCPIGIIVTSGNYGTNQDYNAKVGLILEDFETGVLGEGWSSNSSSPWRIDDQNPYEGAYCVKSGAIGNNSSTTLTLTHEAGSNDTIAFYYAVSSESGYDKLHFYIDNNERGNWSGNVSWTRASYPVIAGRHTYSWTYTKDQSVASGQDCAWIDYVSLPADRVMAGTAGNDVTICPEDQAQIIGYAINYDQLSWSTSGDGTFLDANTATPIYIPGEQDIEDGQATITLTLTSGLETLTDDMMVNIIGLPSLENAMVDPIYCAVAEPHDIGVMITGDYASFEWTTLGDGTFGDANEPMTTYTPGEQDLINGSVTLTATAESQGCGSTIVEIPFVMNPLPSFSILMPNCVLNLCQGQDLTMGIEATGFIDGVMTLEFNDETITIDESTESVLIPAADLEPGEYQAVFRNPSNGYCSTEMEFTVPFTIKENPDLTVGTNTFTICEGETVQFELTATGGLGEYIVTGTGVEPLQFNGESYVIELTPTENTEIHLTQIEAVDGIGCYGNCVKDVDLTLSVEVLPIIEVPVIEGEAELDLFNTLTSTYSVTNDVMVTFELEPAEAGTLVPANDGKSVVVNWTPSYKGSATLTANPTVEECNQGGSSFDITLKNSTEVAEGMNKPLVYPNPSSDRINIQGVDMTHIAIYSTIGQLMYEANVNGHETSVEVGQFPAGTYVVRITCGEQTHTQLINIVK